MFSFFLYSGEKKLTNVCMKHRAPSFKQIKYHTRALYRLKVTEKEMFADWFTGRKSDRQTNRKTDRSKTLPPPPNYLNRGHKNFISMTWQPIWGWASKLYHDWMTLLICLTMTLFKVIYYTLGKVKATSVHGNAKNWLHWLPSEFNIVNGR